MRYRGEDRDRAPPASSMRDARAAGSPQRARPRRSRRASVSGERRQHDVAAVEQRRRTPRAAPVCSVPAIGCAGHEARQRVAEAPRARRRSTSCLVLPASVTTVRGAEARRDRREQRRRYCATGVATQHDVGVGAARRSSARRASTRDRSTPRASARVEVGAACGRRRRPRATAPARLQRQRERAADQADADDDELVDAHARHARRERSRERARGSARSRSGSPTVTRRYSGRP